MATPGSPTTTTIPLAYTLFFHWIEPVATAIGAYYAHFLPATYMSLTQNLAIGLPPTVSTREQIVLTQLANLYFVFALNEALVLRCTSDRRVWRVFLLGLLIADFGHLYSCLPLQGWDIYWRVWEWNEIYWGNLGFVYVGASMRLAFLMGIGLDGQEKKVKR